MRPAWAPGMQALQRYWMDRAANEPAIRGFLTSTPNAPVRRWSPRPDEHQPDLWELDQRYLELPGRDQVMLDLLYDYPHNVELYPRWQEYRRANQPPALLPWGQNDH